MKAIEIAPGVYVSYDFERLTGPVGTDYLVESRRGSFHRAVMQEDGLRVDPVAVMDNVR